MAERFKTYEGGLFYATLSVVGWIDIFTRAEYCNLIEDNLNFCINNKGLKVYCYCIMSNHVHVIASSETTLLSYLLRDFKSYTSKELTKAIKNNPQESRKEWILYLFQYFANQQPNQDYQVWQHGNHSIELDSNYLIEQKVDYIHQNPVRARMVTEAHHYIYSSANPDCKVKLSPL